MNKKISKNIDHLNTVNNRDLIDRPLYPENVAGTLLGIHGTFTKVDLPLIQKATLTVFKGLK